MTTYSRQQQILDKLGITQYQLVRPNLLQGEVNIVVADNIRLILVSSQSLELEDPFFLNIIDSMNVKKSEVLCIKPDNCRMLTSYEHIIFWLIGLDQAFISPVKSTIVTPNLSDLASPTAKKMLWKQICHYENYFFTS